MAAPTSPLPRIARLGAALLCVGALAGCGDKTAAKLEGTWKGARAEGVDAPQKPAADAFATALRLDFKGHELTLTSPKGQQRGPYKILASDGTNITLATERDGLDGKQSFVLGADGTLKWKIDGAKQIVFTK